VRLIYIILALKIALNSALI